MSKSDVSVLSKEAIQKIDHWLTKYPSNQRQSAVMAALTIVQEENGGFLNRDLMDAIATYLQMPNIAVYEVATFYSMYELKPIGRHKISLCTNISCMLRGSETIADYLKQKLGIDFGQTTKDNRFTLKSVECLAACCGAPAMQIGHQYYEHLTPENVDSILDSLE